MRLENGLKLIDQVRVGVKLSIRLENGWKQIIKIKDWMEIEKVRGW